MQDVPKIVTKRLRAAVPVVNHPDADVLTAFSERSLPEQERATVLEHLAFCGDCREIVALALPTPEVTQMVIRPASSGWLSWPALRWGFVALGVFAIASLVVVQYRKASVHPSSTAQVSLAEGPVKEAKNVAPPPAASPSASDQEKATIPSAPVPANVPAPKAKLTANAPAEFDRLETYTRLDGAQPLAKKGAGAIADKAAGGPLQLSHGPRVQYQNALNQNAQANSNGLQNNSFHGQESTPSPFAKQAPNTWVDANASAAPAVPPVEAQGQTAQLEVEGRNPQPLQLESKNLPLKPTEGGQGQTVERAKEADIVVGMSRSKVPASSPAVPGAFTGALSAPNASWTIAAGGLQRSLDQGKTWQNVDVSAPPGAAANYALAAVRASTTDARKDLKQNATPPVFRAVAANGPNVWAGGSSGLLYHSSDSGAHWTRIVPSSGASVLTGDIVSLDFPDTQRGKVTTSTPEVWVTSDGGQTWQKQ